MKNLVLSAAIVIAALTINAQSLVSKTWKYSTGIDWGTAWRAPVYNDALWAAGDVELGYGDGDEATVIPSGSTLNHHPTAYFRQSFNMANPAAYYSYKLQVKRDDGIIVYLNGTEVFRDNMPNGAPSYNMWSSANAGDDGDDWLVTYLPASAFVSGANVFAVEVHQASAISSDLTFNLDLTADTLPATLTRGPYLQLGTETSIILRWKTDKANDSKVMYGTNAGNLTQVTLDNAFTTNHEVKLTGLTAGTRYYYAIGSSAQTLQGDSLNYFYTAPPAGSEKTVRIWATGDCGSAATIQAKVRDAYQNYVGNNYTDAWLLMGDNAYNGGYENEYQQGFFQPYMAGKVMRQTVIWPSPGNHDYDNSIVLLSNRSTPYYNNFTMPTAGEAGGEPSGTEAFYSYNYGNIHFISLDSYGTEAGNKMYDTTGAQAVWLKKDLAANTQKWTIAYWHHPPYTKGSHDSDLELDLVAIRQNVIRIMDRYKVDLILCGHSHLYERSKLMKGHYGNEGSFNGNTHNPSSSSGKYDGSNNSCPYIKSSTSPANEGILYVVAGSSGKLSGTSLSYPHNAMYYSNNSLGSSLYLEVNGNRLDGKMITENGTILDAFTIMKDVNKTIDTTVTYGQSLTLNASWPGVYQWNPDTSTARTITAAPSTSLTYAVTDGSYNCLRDTFNVNVVVPPISITANVTDVKCNDTAIGAIDISVTGGITPYTYAWNNAAQTEDLTALTAGTYTVTVTDSLSTIATALFTVNTTLIPVPATPVITAGATSACGGDTITFSVTPDSTATNYTWTAPANATLLSGQGTTSARVLFFNIYATDSLTVYATNCGGNSPQQAITINRIVEPAAPVTITGDTGLCADSSAVFTVTADPAATSYDWLVSPGWTLVSGQGTNTVTVKAGASAGFVKVAAVNNCGYSLYTQKNVSLCLHDTTGTGIGNGEDMLKSILIYPNPADDYVQFNLLFTRPGIAIVKVFDVTGKLVAEVFKGHVTANTAYNKRLVTREWQSGVYTLQVTCNGVSTNNRFVVGK